MTPIERGCLTKVRFDTELLARGEAVRLYRKLGVMQSVYSCANCDGWHLTTNKTSPETGRPTRSRAEVRAIQEATRQAHKRRHRRSR